jgi:SAM-dependent methyltransferase
VDTPAQARVARVRDVFDEWARHGRADGMADSHAPVAARAFDRLALPADGWFVDIGCGNGYVVRWAAERAPRGRAMGIDVAPEMIARAEALSAAYANVEFVVTQFPEGHSLPRGKFAAVFSMEVFYYFPDLQAALVETLGLLKPGGRFACTVDYYFENTASHSWPADVGVDMTLLDEAGWRDAFRKAGFTHLHQERLRLPATEATEPWKATEGSLLTLGRRP